VLCVSEYVLCEGVRCLCGLFVCSNVCVGALCVWVWGEFFV